MQKATYYDSSAIYSGYPYQSANGFGYDANQVQYPRASHVESEYHRPACSLQSPGGGSVALQKPGEMVAEGCDRAIQAAQAKVLPESNHQAPVPVSGPPPPPSQSPGGVSQDASNGSGQPGAAKSGSPTSGTRNKQIFPWMKESRQNTKQKPASSSSSGTSCRRHTNRDSYIQCTGVVERGGQVRVCREVGKPQQSISLLPGKVMLFNCLSCGILGEPFAVTNQFDEATSCKDWPTFY